MVEATQADREAAVKEIEDTLNKALVNESFATEITAILEAISPR